MAVSYLFEFLTELSKVSAAPTCDAFMTLGTKTETRSKLKMVAGVRWRP